MGILHLQNFQFHLWLLRTFFLGWSGLFIGRQEENGPPTKEQEVGVVVLEEVEGDNDEEEKNGIKYKHLINGKKTIQFIY